MDESNVMTLAMTLDMTLAIMLAIMLGDIFVAPEVFAEVLADHCI